MPAAWTGPPIVCVSGAGTDAGKTVLTAALLRLCARLGIAAQAVKAVQTGCGSLDSDESVYKVAAPGMPTATLLRYACPASPCLAAALEGRTIDGDALADSVLAQARRFAEQAGGAALTLVEGAGGLLSPVTARLGIIDIFHRLNAPVVLAASNGLGAVNHVLLSLEALRARGMRIAGVVLTDAPSGAGELERRIAEDNALSILRMGALDGPPVRLPWLEGLRGDDEGVRERCWDCLAEAVRPLLHLFP